MKKLIKIYWWITQSNVNIAIFVLIFASVFFLGIGMMTGFLTEKEFLRGIFVESFGMLLDLLIIGVFITWLLNRTQRRQLKLRYLDEIDDFRGWASKEASIRIRGNIVRLNKLKAWNIHLADCYLHEANLWGAILPEANMHRANLKDAILNQANLYHANLSNANLQGANLSGADLRKAVLNKANLKKANLEKAILTDTFLKDVNLDGVKGLTMEQLQTARRWEQSHNIPEYVFNSKKDFQKYLDEKINELIDKKK
jgi:BTB/POZ domain-containing protein KCTD9